MAEENPSKLEIGMNACLTTLESITDNPVEAFGDVPLLQKMCGDKAWTSLRSNMVDSR
jgi:hypothetical protein